MRLNGQALFEIVVGIACLVPVLLILFDLFIVFLGVQMNESLCATAVRAVASGAPELAEHRARMVVNAESYASPLISGFKLVPPVVLKLEAQPAGTAPLADSSELRNHAVRGMATLSTMVEVKPILLHRFYGGENAFKFTVTKSCPITFIRTASNDTLTR